MILQMLVHLQNHLRAQVMRLQVVILHVDLEKVRSISNEMGPLYGHIVACRHVVLTFLG